MTTPVIEYRNVTKRFSASGKVTTALDDVSLKIEHNAFTSVVGPSGCGKTTLLRLCAGLESSTEGQTLYQGDAVDGINTKAGFVTQESNLYPWMTLRENVEFPLTIRKMGSKERRDRAQAYIDMVGLHGFEDHYPHQLSGGMQKRGSIIRTMVYDPEVILMDEPFGPLDAQTRMVLQADLLRVWSHRKQTILFITHDLTEAVALSDNVVVMASHPGRIKDVFEIRLERPRDVFRIHSQPGFSETYDRLWDAFRKELVEEGEGPDERAELPPILGATASGGGG